MHWMTSVAMSSLARRWWRTAVMGAAACAVSLGAVAQTELPAAQVQALASKLSQRLQDLPPIQSARTTPWAGLIELRAGDNIFYTDANGDHLIVGQLIDTRNQRNLTEERLEDINRIEFANLPLRDAVVWKQGTGARKVAVFSDPNCGYCKRLEREFQSMKDITVYTFMVPVLGPDSRAKSEAIWCMKDRTEAWLGWMLRGVQPQRSLGQCVNPIDRNAALSQRLRVRGTPAIFFEDGTRLPGYAAAAQLEQRLDRARSALRATR